MTEEDFQEREAEKEKKQEQKKRNAANNAQALRVAAKVAENTPEATIATAGKIVSTADKLTGGKSTELLGRAMNVATPKPIQGVINKAADSGALDAAGMIASNQGENTPKKSPVNENGQIKNTAGPASNTENKTKESSKETTTTISTGEEEKKEKPPILIIIIIGIFLFTIISTIILIASFFSIGSFSHGSFKYGVTCPTITVTDTGCDGDAKNCTHKYDGKVVFEDYIAGVVAAEVPNVKNLEFYKAAAIAARTYFLDHADSSCTVKGNAGYQGYKDINDISDTQDAELIKQAVEETNGLIMVKNGKLMAGHYAAACVVNANENYYYVRYGSVSLGEKKIQEIPKIWNLEAPSPYDGDLAYWYSLVDQNDKNYNTKTLS